MNEENISSIRDKALQYLSMRMHSVKELENKLRIKFPERDDDIQEILQECIRTKLLDDELFAEQYIHHRQETSPRGKFALRMELFERGVPEKIIKRALQEITDEMEYETAKFVAEKKMALFSPFEEEKKKKEKLFRYLASRGFPKGMIFQILEEM